MKLSPLTIYIIGISLALPAIAFGVFYNMMPNNQEAEYYETATQDLQAQAAKQRQAEEKVEQAIELVKGREVLWRSIVAAHTPTASVSTGGINLAVNAFQLTEDTRKYRNSLQRALNTQLKRGGVEVINGPLVPMVGANEQANSVLRTFYNYPDAGFPVVILNLGTVTVQGNYNQIMNHVRSFKSMPRYLAVTDALQLNGTSPNLTATYNLTIVGYIPSTAVYGQAPEGATAGGAAGGAPGGPAGGPPGGPGGAPGGRGRQMLSPAG